MLKLVYYTIYDILNILRLVYYTIINIILWLQTDWNSKRSSTVERWQKYE